MGNRRIAALVVVLGVGAAGVGTTQTFEPLDFSGEELYLRYCAACHGADARGTGPVARTMNKRVPDLTRLAEAADGSFPAAGIRDAIDGRSMAIAHGTRQMPVWGYEFWVEEGADIDAERAAREIVNRLVAYLESIQAPSDTAGLP
ncbi:MAG TPA: c-type cytochrome [Gammaproteobacteria bacterium]|nr:c-type cytochrome [Gammaproteobacteria bacterium]